LVDRGKLFCRFSKSHETKRPYAHFTANFGGANGNIFLHLLKTGKIFCRSHSQKAGYFAGFPGNEEWQENRQKTGKLTVSQTLPVDYYYSWYWNSFSAQDI